MAYTTISNTASLADWLKYNSDLDVEYQLHEPEPSAITLMAGGMNSEEMIRIDRDGFYVRGVRVPTDENEARAVYESFKAWLTWAQLTKNS